MGWWGPYKWPYKWVTEVITLLTEVTTPFITDRGPPCKLPFKINVDMKLAILTLYILNSWLSYFQSTKKKSLPNKFPQIQCVYILHVIRVLIQNHDTCLKKNICIPPTTGSRYPKNPFSMCLFRRTNHHPWMGWLVGGSCHLNSSDPNHQPWRYRIPNGRMTWRSPGFFLGEKKLGFKQRNSSKHNQEKTWKKGRCQEANLIRVVPKNIKIANFPKKNSPTGFQGHIPLHTHTKKK